jgi:hypothetical protein
MLVGKPEGKTPLGRSRSRWEKSRLDLGEIGRKLVALIHQVQEKALMNTTMKFGFP